MPGFSIRKELHRVNRGERCVFASVIQMTVRMFLCWGETMMIVLLSEDCQLIVEERRYNILWEIRYSHILWTSLVNGVCPKIEHLCRIASLPTFTHTHTHMHTIQPT